MLSQSTSSSAAQYVGPYRLEKTLGKGQTGEFICFFIFREKKINLFMRSYLVCNNLYTMYYICSII